MSKRDSRTLLKAADVRNRIKELRYVDTADIVSHPGNWRDHPEAQANALAGVLREVGIADALLAYESERNGGKLTLIDGHLRKDSAPGKWPVLVLDVDDAEADYVLATFDTVTSMAVADKAALDALLSAVNSGEAAVQQMLTDEAQKAGLYIEHRDPVDRDELWQGMPEFEQEDAFGVAKLIVHFETQDDLKAFAELVQQTVTDKTKYIWFPAKEHIPMKEYTIESES